MKFPQRGVEIIDAFLLRNPELAKGNDENRRLLTRTIAEQIRYELGVGWGTKSADKTRPQSKDSVSYFINGTLFNWDWQNGDTRKRQVQAGQEGTDISDQWFIPVAAMNRLGVPAPGSTEPPPIEPPTPPLPPAPSTTAIEKLQLDVQNLIQSQTQVVRAITELVKNQQALVNAAEELKLKADRSYTARIFGATVRFVPE